LTASHVLSGDSRVMQTITRYLETLRSSVDGGELYGLISRTLRRHTRNGPLGPDYLIDLYGQLDAYARDAVSAPSMRIRARLLQQHIAPYISDLKAPPLPEPAPIPTVEVEEIRLPPTLAAAAPSTVAAGPEPANVTAVEGVLERPGEKEQAATEERTEKYQNLLRSEKDAWQAIYGTVKDYQRLKDAWLKSLDELSRQRDALEEKLVKTTEQLSQLEVEHDKVRTELQSALTAPKRARIPAIPRLLSRGNRPGPLPKRDGFIRTLEAEIKRIKRSGAPLALGLIGVENLEVLIERYGQEAATAALRCYAEEVLSNFRAYDIVGIYDNDQFIVMFPDTPKEGARRALEKAYKRAVETHLNYGGESIPLPPFAGALITYSAGEDPAKFLGRAGEALQQARTSGNRGVMLS
jgi:diguanylate cyclase (GGDEF)-like protein